MLRKHLIICYVAVGLVAAASFVWLLSEENRSNPQNYWHLAALIGSILVAAGWIVASENTVKNSQRQLTISTILSYDSNKVSQDHRNVINQYIPYPNKLIPNANSNPVIKPYSEVSDPLYIAVDFELNMCDFIATGVRNEVLDMALITDTFQAKFLGFREQTADYIKFAQSKYDASTWIQFEWLCDQWSAKSAPRASPLKTYGIPSLCLVVGGVIGYFLRRL